MTTPKVEVQELRTGLYRPVTTRSCGHKHEGPKYNTAPEARAYGEYVLEHCVCGTCRGHRS